MESLSEVFYVLNTLHLHSMARQAWVEYRQAAARKGWFEQQRMDMARVRWTHATEELARRGQITYWWERQEPWTRG